MPADRLHVSTFMTRETTVSKRKHRERLRNVTLMRRPLRYVNIIRVVWLKERHKMEEADLTKKTE